MACGSIYKIVFPNGKNYIGLTTTSLEHRQKGHKTCAKRGAAKLQFVSVTMKATSGIKVDSKLFPFL